jgi:uncharacterized caspase-like protein
MGTSDAPGERRALLVAADEYVDPALTQLRAPVGDVNALAEVLGDAMLGDFEVGRMINRPTEETKRAIESFFEEARPGDLLLLYMSGHGVLSQTRHFYFATASTELKWLRATAIEDTFVNDVMQHSRARSIVLIVDCCHSGAFARGLTPKGPSAVDVVPRFEGRGRVTLTASTELEYAFEEAGRGDSVSNLGASAPGSIFTRFLVEGIQTGAADANRDGEISIDEIYDYVYARVREHSPHQTPGKGGGGYGDLIVAHGRKASLQLDVRQALASPLAGVREATVAELTQMRTAANPGMRQTIDKALRGLLDDDSQRVRDAAAAALGDAPGAQPGTPPPPPPAPPHTPPPRTPPPTPPSQRSALAQTLRRRRGVLAGALAVVLAGVVVAIVASSGGGSNGSSGSSTVSLPANPARGTELGSDLTPTYLNTCFGPNETCSVVQYALTGRPTVAARDGVIRKWAARGVGRVALQVVTLTPARATASAQSAFVTLNGHGPQFFQTDVPIKRGDFIALLMCAGARVATGGNNSDVDLRWDNGLLVGQPRPSSETQSETEEYAFNATIDTGRAATTTSTGASPGPCPAG